ncbi:MAG: hypothetical protein BGO78_10115 [Chloroflexi bacterium 44-23]|nr:MAG: hypothetical protein BGO78_10115 [Chloroflexi bacterium 44-23]
MNLLIIGYFKFPFGDAGGTRIRNIATGLCSLGINVTVITQSSTTKTDLLEQDNDWSYFQKVKYKSANGLIKTGGKSFFKKTINFLLSIRKSVDYMEELMLNEKIDIVLLYTVGFIESFPIYCFCKRRHIPLVSDVVEWTTPGVFTFWLFDFNFLSSLLKRLIVDKHSDGLLVISSFLERKFSKSVKNIIKIPSIYDFENDPFLKMSKVKISNGEINLTFVGGIKKSDGLIYIIDSLDILQNLGIHVKLHIIGVEKNSQKAIQLLNYSNEIVNKHVIFRGNLSDNDYYKALYEADILLLPRERTIMTIAAFPTRLVEFLASGRPIITSDILDISMYLVDRKEAHLISPSCSKEISNRIIEIISNKESAIALGIAGREKAKLCFDNREHVKTIKNFLESIVIDS